MAAIYIRWYASGTRNIYVSNCIFADWRSGDDDTNSAAINTHNGTAVYAYNNTFVNCSRAVTSLIDM